MARTSSSTAGRRPSLGDGRLRLPDGRRRRSVSRRRPRRYRPSPPAEAFTTLPLTSRTVGAGAVLADASAGGGSRSRFRRTSGRCGRPEAAPRSVAFRLAPARPAPCQFKSASALKASLLTRQVVFAARSYVLSLNGRKAVAAIPAPSPARGFAGLTRQIGR